MFIKAEMESILNGDIYKSKIWHSMLDSRKNQKIISYLFEDIFEHTVGSYRRIEKSGYLFHILILR